MTAETIEFKRTLRAHDLAYLAGKKRQSPRTGFVHLFHGNETAADTIPLYENFCYVLALLLQKKGDSVLEAKKLLMRLFPFQTQEGNFPIYLHDFPLSYDFYLGLKIAPLLLRIRTFKAVLGADTVEKIDSTLRKILSFYEEKTLSPLWEFRRAICQKITPPSLEVSNFSPQEWWEYWVSLQFLESPICRFYHSGLQMAKGFDRQQERFEPAPYLIDWLACQEEFQPRLIQDRSIQIQLVALEKVHLESDDSSSIYSENGNFFWKGSTLHSLVLEGGPELPKIFELGREDLFEVAYYCDASEEIEVFIEGKKGTIFALGDTITIQSPERKFSLTFELLTGDGEFCGHLFRANRPGQIATHEAFDWKIALRTLRRSPDCTLRVQLRY